MEEILVTRVWMAGVVAMMIVFGVIAMVGYARSRKDRSLPPSASRASHDEAHPACHSHRTEDRP